MVEKFLAHCSNDDLQPCNFDSICMSCDGIDVGRRLCLDANPIADCIVCDLRAKLGLRKDSFLSFQM